MLSLQLCYFFLFIGVHSTSVSLADAEGSGNMPSKRPTKFFVLQKTNFRTNLPAFISGRDNA